MHENENLELYLEEDDPEDEAEHYIDPQKGDTLRVGDRRLVTQPYDFAVKTLVTEIEDGVINIGPEWQRRIVWGSKLKSRLIESLIMNVPIPVLYFAEDEQERYIVIDGQQRLRAIYEFMKNKYRLEGLTEYESFKGLHFNELPDEIQRRIRSRTIRCIAVMRESDPDLVFDIFTRLNSGVVPLNTQEMRNCIYSGPFNDLLVELAEEETWLSLLRRKKSDARMKGEELILRFLALDNRGVHKYSTPIREFLNSFMREFRKANPSKLRSFRKSFMKAVENTAIIFGQDAFRRWDPKSKQFTGPYNKALADVVLINLVHLDSGEVKKKAEALLNGYKNLFKKDEFIDTTVKSTADASKLRKRIEMYARVVKRSCQPVS